jgi:phage gp36-like protein
MSYASQSDLEFWAGGSERFRQLMDWNGTGVIDADAVTRALSSADAWIDQYLRTRYKTPIATPSDTLKRIASEEAIYVLKTARGMDQLTQADIEKRKERMAELEQMRRGALRPDEPTPEKSSAVKSAIVELSGDVTREKTKGLW